MDTQKIEAGDTLNPRPIYTDWAVCAIGLSEVQSNLFGLVGVEGQVAIGTPCHQVLDLLPEGRLIVVTDDVYKLDNAIGAMYRMYRIGLSTQPCGTPVFRVRV